MQIGIDLGATKIEYVLLDNNNKELERNRSETPKNFADTIKSICETSLCNSSTSGWSLEP